MRLALVALLALGCGDSVCWLGGHVVFTQEIEGNCGALGHVPSLECCERLKQEAAADGSCSGRLVYECLRGSAVVTVDLTLEHLRGFAEVTWVGPAPEQLGESALLCRSVYAVETFQ